MLPGADKADELHDHDERAGCCFCQAKSIHHLARLQPAVVKKRLLRDVRQHRVVATEGHDRCFAEKQAFIEKSAVPTFCQPGNNCRRDPERHAHEDDTNCAGE